MARIRKVGITLANISHTHRDGNRPLQLPAFSAAGLNAEGCLAR